MAYRFLLPLLQIFLLYLPRICSGSPKKLEHNIVILNWCSNDQLSYELDYNFNLKFIKQKKESLMFYNTTIELQNFIEKRGVSFFIICNDHHTSYSFIDVIAGYLKIPVVKRFYRGRPSPLAQEKDTILHFEPHPSSQLPVITQLLQHYKWKSVAILSDNDDVNLKMTSELMTMLKNTENLALKFLTNFTITFNKDNFALLNLMNDIQVSAVVIFSEHDLAIMFLREAKLHGFTNVVSKCILGAGREILRKQRKLHAVLPSAFFKIRHSTYNDTSITFKHFLRDSIELFKKALINASLSKDYVHHLSNNGCYSEQHDNFGNTVYRAMKLVEINGHTGRILFDQNGFRTNVDYDVDYWFADKDKSGINKKVIARYRNNTLRVLYMGWPPITGEDILEARLAAGLVLRVAVLIQEPYILFNDHYAHNKLGETDCALGLPCFGVDGQQSCCSGYCIDLLNLLQKDIGFSARIHLVKDGKYGGLNYTTGQWSGLIGEVVRGEVDIALAALTINRERSTVVDFTQPFMDAGKGVLVKVFRQKRSNWTSFLDPFAATLWITIITVVNVVLLCMWLLERFSPYGKRNRGKKAEPNRHTLNLIETTWFTWSLVFQNFDVGTRPKSFACRILALSFAFGMLIVISSYTATLAAFLVVEEEILPLSELGIRDVKLQNPPAGFKIATIKDSSTERFFQTTYDPMFHRIWKNMKHHDVQSFAKGIRQMNSRQLQALVTDYPTLENFAAQSQDCSFKVVGKPFLQSGFGLAVRKNSSLTTKISQTLMQYEKYDTARKLKQRWFVGHCSVVNDKDGATFARLAMNDFIGLFLAICLGLIISPIFLIFDFCKVGFKKSSTRQNRDTSYKRRETSV